MKQFDYTIKDQLGIHARPAGMLAKKAKEYGDTVTVAAEGPDEDTAIQESTAADCTLEKLKC